MKNPSGRRRLSGGVVSAGQLAACDTLLRRKKPRVSSPPPARCMPRTWQTRPLTHGRPGPPACEKPLACRRGLHSHGDLAGEPNPDGWPDGWCRQYRQSPCAIRVSGSKLVWILMAGQGLLPYGDLMREEIVEPALLLRESDSTYLIGTVKLAWLPENHLIIYSRADRCQPLLQRIPIAKIASQTKLPFTDPKPCCPGFGTKLFLPRAASGPLLQPGLLGETLSSAMTYPVWPLRNKQIWSSQLCRSKFFCAGIRMMATSYKRLVIKSCARSRQG